MRSIKLENKEAKAHFDLWIYQDVVSENDNDVLRTLREDEEFTFSTKDGGNIRFPMKKRPRIYQVPFDSISAEGIKELFSPPEGFFGQLAVVETFWQLNVVEELTSILLEGLKGNKRDFQKTLIGLLAILKNQTSLSFDGAYSKRIGNFEHFSFPCLQWEGSFSVRIENPSQSTIYGKRLTLSKTRDLVEKAFIVSLVIRNDFDIIEDKVDFFPAGLESMEIGTREPISRYQVKIYDSDKNLVFQEGHVMLRQIITGFGLSEGSFFVEREISKLADKVPGQNKEETRKALNMVNRISTRNRSVVGDFSADPWVQNGNEIRNIVSTITDDSPTCWWFKTGPLQEIECFAFIKTLLNSDAKQVLIVDPFFSSRALSSFIPAIENMEAEYVVLLSMAENKNPDTEGREKVELQRERIANICNRYQDQFIPNNLRIVNAVVGKRQVFHDRYIILRKDKKEVVVYSLSNSLNRAAGKYPMNINLLNNEVGNLVSDYVDGLLKGSYPNEDGTQTSFSLDVVWERDTKRHNRVLSEVKKITEIGPEFYPHWHTFWDHLLNEKDEVKLLERLIKLGVVKETNGSLEWAISETTISALVPLENNEVYAQNPESLMIGFGETLARTHFSDQKTKDRLVTYTKKFIGHEEKLFDAVLKFYDDGSKVIETRDDLAFATLLKSTRFDPALVQNASRIFSYPPRIRSSFWGLRYLIKISLYSGLTSVLDWIVKKKGTNWLASMFFSIVSENIWGYEKQIVGMLIEQDPPIFKALACGYLLYQLNINSPAFGIDEVESWLLSSGFSKPETLWIMLTNTNRLISGNPTNKERELKIREYLSRFLPLLSTGFSIEDKANILGALEQKVENIWILANLFFERDRDLQKVDFLFEACIIGLDKVLSEQDYVLFDDQTMVLIGRVAIAFLSLHQDRVVSEAFYKKYEMPLWKEICEKLSFPFASVTCIDWEGCMRKSVLLLYFGYTLLLTGRDTNNVTDQQFEEYLWHKLVHIVRGNLRLWAINQKESFVNQLVNLVTRYYSERGIGNTELVLLIDEGFSPLYLRVTLATMDSTRFSERIDLISDLAKEMLIESTDINSVLTFFDSWVFVSSQVDFVDRNEIDGFISAFISKNLSKFPGQSENKWIVYFRDIVSILRKEKKIDHTFLADEDFQNLKTIGLIRSLMLDSD